MKLYDVPRHTLIDVSDLGLKNTQTGEPIDILLFKNIDGMYSRCYDEYGNLVHLGATVDVEIFDGKTLKREHA